MNTFHTLWRAALCGLGLAFLLAGPVWAEPAITQRIEWKKVPIRLDLSTGSERIVHFPGPVRVGVPASLRPVLRAQSLDGTVYFLASAPFDATRILVRSLEAGRFYLLDIAASGVGTPMPPVQVYVKEADGPHSLTRPQAPLDDRPARAPYGYVALTRFAAHQLYAPARLVQDRPGIVRMPVSRDPVALLRGGVVDAVPLVAWRAGGLYVTAVRLTNRTGQPQILDPRTLRGTWLAATFQHHHLLGVGSDADTTVVYLVSARPFETAR